MSTRRAEIGYEHIILTDPDPRRPAPNLASSACEAGKEEAWELWDILRCRDWLFSLAVFRYSSLLSAAVFLLLFRRCGPQKTRVSAAERDPAAVFSRHYQRYQRALGPEIQAPSAFLQRGLEKSRCPSRAYFVKLPLAPPFSRVCKGEDRLNGLTAFRR
jgi:hypothetical protein